MTITVFVVLLSLGFIVYVARLMRRRKTETDAARLYKQLQPIHLPALLNLLNPDDLSFLRINLSHSDFLALKRRRTRALMDYVRRIGLNARVLTSIGALRRQSALPDVAAAGQTLASHALTTRILAVRTLFFLELELVLPFFDTNLAPTIKAYEKARARLDESSATSLAAR